MYLIAPFAALFVPLLGLPFGILGLLSDRGHQKIYIICISLAMASLAYGYQATAETDMVRYWQMVEEYAERRITLSNAFLTGFYGASSEENLWLVNVLIWLASQIRDQRILPALSTFFVYYMSLNITCRFCKDSKIKKGQMVFYVVFSLVALNLYSIANNVRNVLAFMMISYATFYDIYLKKRKPWIYLLYFLPIFLHTSAILFLVLRLFIRPVRRIKLLGVIAVISLYPVLELLRTLAERMTGSLEIAGNMIMKAYRYFNDTSTEWGLEVQASGSEKVFKILYITIVVILCVLWIITEKKRPAGGILNLSEEKPGLALMNDYTFYVCLMAVACVPMLRPEYWRFTATAIALGGGIFVRSKSPGIRSIFIDLIWFAMMILGIFCMVLWLRNMTIYADLPSTVISAAGASPLVILVRAIMNLFG